MSVPPIRVNARIIINDGMLQRYIVKAPKRFRDGMGNLLDIAVPIAQQFVRKDTESLMESIDWEEEGEGWVLRDGPGVRGRSYGAYQELGTYKMSAQPFLEPSLRLTFTAENIRAVFNTFNDPP